MKSWCLLLLLVLVLLDKGHSQVEVRNLKTSNYNAQPSELYSISSNSDFEKRIGIKPIAESDCDVEIRFYTHEALSNTKDLKILTLKNGIWKGILYDELNYPIRRIRKYKLVARNGFGKLYDSLLASNLTTLPSQNELRQKMRKVTVRNGQEVEHRIDVTDGQSFAVEYQITGNQRTFTFYNPEPYSKFYSNVQELKDYIKIRNLFETELKKK